ncbi:MAG: D-alanine--D-alanine ligase, partial [Bacteroidetes bacterium]|nr:D-alanine--D-alanine ligase [Bacteroidota bacterium]
MKRRCCILYNEPAPGAGPDEMDVLDQVGLVEEQLQKLGLEVYRIGIGTDFMDKITSLLHNPPDFVFNLVESINNQGKLVYFAPALLGQNGFRYTGCPVEAIFITSNKKLAAKFMELGGIPVPESVRPDEIRRL